MESKKSTTYVYKIEDSAERMDDILDAKCTVDGTTYYEGNIIWDPIENWYKENCR